MGSVPVATGKGRSYSASPHRAMDDASHSSTTISNSRDHHLVHIQFNGLPTATAPPRHTHGHDNTPETKVSFTSLLPVSPGSFRVMCMWSVLRLSTRLTRLDSIENPGSYHLGIPRLYTYLDVVPYHQHQPLHCLLCSSRPATDHSLSIPAAYCQVFVFIIITRRVPKLAISIDPLRHD